MTDSFTTQVPQPTFGPNGITIPIEDAVLTGVQADINTALGGGINPSLTNPTGQLATTETAVIGDSNAKFAWFVNQVDPALNSGRMQDAIGRLYFMTRIAAMPTIQPVIVAGLDNTPIGAASIIATDNNNNQWVVQQAGMITGGSVTLNFAAAVAGPIPAPSSLVLYQATAGVESVAPTGAAVIGNAVETAAQYETRRQASVAANSLQMLDSIQGTMLALAGVLDCYCYQNDTSAAVTVGGVLIGANSIYVCVLGGVQLAVATAIWTKKGPGAPYTGNTVVVVTDPNPAYSPPAPTYSVTYQTPTIVSFAVMVTLKSNSGVPANAQSLIATAVIDAFAGLDGGARAKIGSTVFAARYYAGVAALGAWAQVVSIQLGLLGTAWSGTASISGTTLTVVGTSSGALAIGQLLQDAGLLAGGTMITAGSGTSWTVSISQTIASESMTGTTLINDVTMGISQAPAVSAINVNLVTV